MDSLKNTFIFIVLLLPTLCYSNNYVSTVSYYTTPDGMGTPSMLFFSPSKISKFIYIYVFFSKKNSHPVFGTFIRVPTKFGWHIAKPIDTFYKIFFIPKTQIQNL